MLPPPFSMKLEAAVSFEKTEHICQNTRLYFIEDGTLNDSLWIGSAVCLYCTLRRQVPLCTWRGQLYLSTSCLLHYVASFFAAVGVNGAGGRAFWLWSGKGWVFICSELQCDKVSSTYRGGETTLDQTWRCRCISDLLLANRLKITRAKNRALHYNTWHTAWGTTRPQPLPLSIIKTINNWNFITRDTNVQLRI